MTVLGSKRIIAGLALTSAGSLAFEISLTRVFAVQQFHSFAFVVVSLAVWGRPPADWSWRSGRGLRRWNGFHQPELSACLSLT